MCSIYSNLTDDRLCMYVGTSTAGISLTLFPYSDVSLPRVNSHTNIYTTAGLWQHYITVKCNTLGCKWSESAITLMDYNMIQEALHSVCSLIHIFDFRKCSITVSAIKHNHVGYSSQSIDGTLNNTVGLICLMMILMSCVFFSLFFPQYESPKESPAI